MRFFNLIIVLQFLVNLTAFTVDENLTNHSKKLEKFNTIYADKDLLIVKLKKEKDKQILRNALLKESFSFEDTLESDMDCGLNIVFSGKSFQIKEVMRVIKELDPTFSQDGLDKILLSCTANLFCLSVQDQITTKKPFYKTHKACR